MKEQFVPYKLALKLKELGFDEECLAGYSVWQNPTKQDADIQFHIPSGKYSNWSPIPFYGKYSHRTKDLIKAPLWQQAFSWFEEKYDFHINIFGDGFNGELKGFYYSITEEGWINYYESIDSGKWYDTKEEARLACLEKLIELCKKN